MSEPNDDYWRVQAADVLTQLHEAERENAELRRRLDTVMHTGDMEHARMAALLGASQGMINQLAVLRYPDESSLWRLGGGALESAYEELKRATAAVRPQANAMLARLADLSRLVGEQNTTIGYQDAMLADFQRANGEVAQLNADYLIALDAAYHALMSYANKNSAPDYCRIIRIHGSLDARSRICSASGRRPSSPRWPRSGRSCASGQSMRACQGVNGSNGRWPGWHGRMQRSYGSSGTSTARPIIGI